jgi:hypothetical protein
LNVRKAELQVSQNHLQFNWLSEFSISLGLSQIPGINQPNSLRIRLGDMRIGMLGYMPGFTLTGQ